MRNRALVDLTLAALPYLPVTAAAYALWTGNSVVLWSALGVLFVLFLVAIAAGFSFSVMILFETVRRWRTYSVKEKWWRGMVAAWITSGLIAVALGAWALFDFRTAFDFQLG